MSRSHILTLLKSNGKTVSSVARSLNVHVQTVYDSIHRVGVRRVRLEISFIIGRPPSLLFPDLPPKTKMLDDFEFMNFKSSK